MTQIAISEILVEDRQREKVERKPLEELKASIVENTLLQPLVLVKSEGGYRLVAGERRLRALTELHEANIAVLHAEQRLEWGHVPATVLDEREIAQLLSMELDENARRVQLTWQEEVKAIEAIHLAKQEANPKQTALGTARELRSVMSGAAGGELSEPRARDKVSESLMLAKHLNRPDIKKAKSHTEARGILLRESQERFSAELARRRMSKAMVAKRLWDLQQGDLKDLLPEVDDGVVDLILVDPPYGIGQHKEKYAATNFHHYDDSEAYALDICTYVIQEGWRVTKNKANLFLFCSLRHFPVLREAAQKMGWQVWQHPLIWHKSKSEGEAPWGRLGFFKAYECILYATKGERGIKGPVSEVFDAERFPKLHPTNKTHGAQKPTSLLEYMIELTTYPNDLVLDPCAGSGSSLFAATHKSRRSLGFENDEVYYNRALSALTEMEERKTADAPVDASEVEEEFGIDTESEAELQVGGE